MSLGQSILVPCVQELVKECPEKVPGRYIVRDLETETVATITDYEVPVVNLEALVNGDEKELQRLHSACQEWGFFQLINHGVPSALVEKCKQETEDFFDMPIEEKKRYWQTTSELEGFGQAYIKSEDQKLPWSDMFYMSMLPKHKRKPHLHPNLPLPYRDTIEQYSMELQNVAVRILDCIATALKIETEVMRSIFGECRQSIRMNCYPPCPEPDKVIGALAHEDITALTILLQANGVDGLQLEKDGKWVPVIPLEGAFMVNIGNVLVLLSNGIYQSITHRVVVSSKKRISVGTLHTPSLDKEIAPISSLVTPETPAKFKKVDMITYFKEQFATTRSTRSPIEPFKI